MSVSLIKRIFILTSICPALLYFIYYKGYFKSTKEPVNLIDEICKDQQTRFCSSRKMKKPSGGTPKTLTLLISTYRSGSSFFGETLSAGGCTFYFFEPFEPLGNIRNLTKAEKYIRNLNACQLKNLDRKVWFHNPALKAKCLKNTRFFCRNTNEAQRYCRAQCRNVMKIVRQPVRLLERFFSAPDADIFNGLFLVRDPRAVMNSRYKLSWCKKDQLCISPKVLCNNMTSNYFEAQALMKKYPKKFTVVRYEDFVGDMKKVSWKLFKFLNLPYEGIPEFLDSHSSANIASAKNKHYSTFRNSTESTIHWMNDLSLAKILQIQKDCRQAMKLWGYKFIQTKDQLSAKFNPVHDNFII